ncbi:MAG: ribonuclease HII [Oscillospiraceae bacterium]|nr:ribonuclease HII [Oscillospiraceae bacterium]
MRDLWEYENKLDLAGTRCICGVDEAGRGPLAGPVCAAAVILPRGLEIPGLDDSKKLTDQRRRTLYDVITEAAEAWSVALADERVIDEINILQATLRAMQEAVAGLTVRPDLALIDGNREPALPMEAVSIVGGDGRSASIAAASILAKVTRDRLMEELDGQYPQYGFAVHKGYPTRRHYAALDEFGPCPLHRRSFLKKYYEKKNEPAGSLG